MSEDLASFVDLRRTTTPRQVADGLQRMILRGALLPGERINESSLSQELRISRNTVREAIRLTEATGLLRHGRNHVGMQVWDPTDDEILDLFWARFHLETLAASSIGPDTDLTSVEQAFQELSEELDHQEPYSIVDKDLRFHSAVVDILQNEFLSATYRRLVQQVRFFSVVLSLEEHEYEDVDGLRAEHWGVVEALRSRNPAIAHQTVGDTVLQTRDDVRRALRKRRARSLAE